MSCMSEEAIERRVCSMTDALDKEYLSTSMTEEVYKAKIKEIDAWAEERYKEIVK